MKTRAIRRIPHFRRDDGQVTIFVVLALALFLLAFLGFAVDMTNLWFHRQMAQGAADAACQAGIMDVLVMAEGGVLPGAGFTPGTGFNCSGSPNSSPCKYAAFNGYNGAGLTAGVPSNEVTVNFPGTVPGSQPPPPSTLAPVPFLRTDVVDRVGLTFATLVMGQRTSDVRAFAECGLVLAKVPIPIIVLNPVCSHSFEVSGSAMLKIVGGPARSVQVNSMSTYPPGPQGCSAATSSSGNSCVGNATIDLSQGGPSFSGSNFGTFGGQLPATPNFLPGTTGSWTPSSPISDPFAMMAPPGPQGPAPAPVAVPYGTDGCPDHTGAAGTPFGNTLGCIEFFPGDYTQPIEVTGFTAIFAPGIYRIVPTSYPGGSSGGGLCGKAGCTDHGPIGGQCRADFVVGSNGVVRPSTNTTFSSIAGTIFYLSKDPGQANYGSVFFGSNAGKYGGRVVDQYNPMNPLMPVRCDGSAPTPAVPMLDGNVLLAPCTGPYGDPLGVSRRMLFFQDRANDQDHGQPTFQGGGGLLLAGTLYFHNCPNSPDCTPGYPTTYNAFLQLQGTPGSSTRVIGNIITDQLIEAGNGSIDMVLDPFSVFYVLKATLLR
jgi:Putative Flp pilus-assembly TadE/G-like